MFIPLKSRKLSGKISAHSNTTICSGSGVFNRSNASTLVVIDFLFFVSPLASILLQIILLVTVKSQSTLMRINYILCISCFLGLINATKVPESDMINYIYWFNLAANMDFFSYIKWFGKEPLYSIMVYIVYVFSGGDQNSFIIIVTSIGYTIILYSLLRIALVLNVSRLVIVALLVGVPFFPQLFSISFHLIRQFLAAGILLVFMANWIVDEKKAWYLLVIAALFHSVIVSIIPFLMMPMLRKRTSLKVVALCAVSLLSAYIILPYFAAFLSFSGVDFISYVGKRASQLKYRTLSPPGPPVYLMIVIGCSLIYYNLKNRTINLLLSPETKNGYYLICSLLIIISMFIIVTARFESTWELSLRYVFFLYYLFPIVALFSSLRNSHARLVAIPVFLLSPVYFIYKLEFGVWTYTNYIDRVLYPLFF